MSSVHEQLGQSLLTARSTREAIAPVRETLPEGTIADAYAIQTVQRDRLLAEGRELIGHKIGLTSLAMQQQLGVDSPDFGFVLDDMVFEAGSSIPVDAFIEPKVEPELAFRLSKDISASATLDDLKDSIEGVYPAIEIIDSRIKNWDIKLIDTISDNASCGAIVVGKQPLDIEFDDLPGVSCTLLIDGEEKAKGEGKDVMGHPLEPLLWLAGVLAEQGEGLKAGQVVLTGSFTQALPVVRGEQVTAHYDGYGELQLVFS
ncbi:2-keto-4-pentenoate hydratase [Rothia nasimurium]|uniref:2-keto-4-pentenoate hydratase n=1 Tax=Rothia nasimurium TaxID=85336 RepID=UPI001F315917|nr:2-keto-4-pentenoate hydratase [Rothia nasimurium]